MNRRSLSLAVALGALFATAAVAAEAPAWSDRARSADRVLVARCERQWSQWEGGRIYTYSEIRTSESVRGGAEATETIRQPGGIVGEIGQLVTHVRLLEADRDYLLFLVPDEGTWTTTDAGVNPVEADARGVRWVGDDRLETVVRELGASS